ncbi:ABC transporter substrate-binding protein [Shewanella youngdeokensis]|uniref:ABC transporter substrate-binding protein n=1 Tax=Shewanella youngdeokensis TaxID=2999068 RepID=A0ABZ0JVA6_9GAMM|nr:ABC transporter substrate-binding protein [Shewanella sp. DAU334]
MNKNLLILITILISYSSAVLAAPDVLKVYFDADRTGHIESALSIEQGVKVAFAQADNQLNGVDVEFVTLDHRGNVGRSKKNMQRFINDNNAIVFVAGFHSPPLIKYREFINESKLLTLVPWAAGGPITRYPSKDNYVFRLSVDDQKVGEHLVDFAIEQQCKKPHMLLENTGWGKSNHRSIKAALASNAIEGVSETWFSWGINAAQARLLFETAKQDNIDCIFMVAGAREGALIVNAVADLDLGISVIGHWGITGGNFAQQVPFETRNKAKLHFVQSCFNFYSSAENEFNKQVFNDAKALFPEQFIDTNIKAPAGFVHGYDLAKILISSASNVTFTDDIVQNRTAIKQALESLSQPVNGLIKSYKKPFSEFSQNAPDAHEALGVNDLCMGVYDNMNAVKLIEKQ